MRVLGLDIGGTGIKGAVVDTDTGELLTERFRLLTPRPSTPAAVAEVVAEVVAHFDWEGPIGCGFPAVVRGGVALTAANIDEHWIGTDAATLLGDATGCPVRVLNDADAAGLAEMRLGAGRGRDGVVLVVTIGTGLGTAIFVDGTLVPNMELGHLEVKGREAEKWASEAAKEREGLSWRKWSKRLDAVLCAYQTYLWPDLIILGGGASKKHDKFLHRLMVDTEVVTAQMLNEAGIVGAALAAVG